MESLNVKNINDEKIFNVIDPNGQGEVVNRIRPISISINQKAQTINDQTDSTINLAVYWNDTWKSILDLTFDESLRQEYGKLTQDLTNIQKDIDMKQYKDAETKTADFLKYVANLSSKYTAIPEKAVVSKIKNDFVKIKADKNSVKVAISDKLLNFMLKKYAKVNNLDYTKSNECFSTSKFNCLTNNYDIYYHSPEIFQKQAYMTVVKDNKVVGSYKVNYDQFSKFASKFMLTPQKLGYSKDRLAGYMKTAEVVMQNIFFDSVDEAKEWQEMVDEKKKEQATAPEGEEETTETTTTETKTEMGEGKSESPVKGDGGLARPSEDFASDEIPESEPRQQEQQGGGQNLGASRRVKNVKKIAGKKLWVEVIYGKGKDDYWVTDMNPNVTDEEVRKYFTGQSFNIDHGFDEKGQPIEKFVRPYEVIIHREDEKQANKNKNVKKTARVGYNAEPENELEEKAVKIGDEIMNVEWDLGEEIQNLEDILEENPKNKRKIEEMILELKGNRIEAIKKVVEKYNKEFANKEIADLVYEHLQDHNAHKANSIVLQVLNGKQSSKKVKLNKKAEDITEIEENYKESDFNIKYKKLVIKDNAFVQEELQPTLPRIRVDFVIYSNTIPNGMAEVEFHCVVKPSKANATIPHIERYTINYDVALDNEIKKQLDSILYNLSNKKIQDFCKYNDKGFLVYKYQVAANKKVKLNKKAEEQIPDEHIYEIIYLGFGQWQYIPTPLKPYIKQVMDILVEKGLAKVHDFGRGKGKYDSDLSIKEYVEKVKNIPEIMSIINKIYQKFGKKSFRLKSLNKKALYGDVQEQDIVPAKTETKVYLQSEDKGNKKQLPNFSVTVRRNSDDEVVDIIECNNQKEAEEIYKYMLSDLDKDCYVSINKLVGKEEYTEIKNSSLDKEESCKKANKNKLVNKKAEEQTVEEKIEQQVGEDGDIKATIGVGDVVTVNFDLIDNSTSEFEKYEEFIGKPMLLMETDKEDINKVIIEETEYPFQRLTIDTDKVELFDDMKGTEIVVEDTDGDEMITTFEELPIVAKQCKIKSIHKAANISKKKANLTKKAINSLEDVAGLIDTIVSDYDWYSYFDSTEVGELSLYDQFLADVQKDEKGTIEEILKYIAEDDDGYTTPEVEQLKEYYNAKFGGK